MIEGWNWLDFLAAGVLLGSALRALFKGLTAELISLASVVLGFFAAALFYPWVGALMKPFGLTPLTGHLLGFLLIFMGCLLAGALAIRSANTLLRVLYLKWVDRLLGGVFGLLRGWLTVAIVFLALAAFPVSSRMVSESQTSAFFLTSASFLVQLMPSDLKTKFEAGYGEIYRKWIEASSARKDQQ